MKLNALTLSVLKFIAILFIALSASRSLLVYQHIDRFGSWNNIYWTFLQGLRVDLIVIGYFYTIPILLSVWFKHGMLSRLVIRLTHVWMVLAFTLIIFLEVVTPEFIAEYDIRPNRIFVDYLAYPAEVSKMLWEGYKPAIALSLAGILVCLFIAYHLLARNDKTESRKLNIKTVTMRIGLSACILILAFVSMRSSLQHRPFNPSVVYFSNDNLINSLPLNSTYSVLFAAYNAQSEKQASAFYGKATEQEVISGVQALAALAPSHVGSQDIPTLRYHEATYQGNHRNIVILLQESLGSRFVGALGGQKLTPELDQLMQEGWNFSNAYATGTRSVRGIEAVFTGFTPGPSRSVVKLSKSQQNFFSLASLLKRHNYTTQFIYGGESHFDNMKSFFLGNGVDLIHDLPEFTSPNFVGSWGASDEDLYNEAHLQFEKLAQDEKPFFSLVFTTSNHSPWEVPDSCNSTFQGEPQTRENAIRYSDCALGKFMRKAKQSSYWDDTIFIVIADHDSRVYGSELVPLEHFKIPALILGKDIPAKRDDRLVSQIDFAPTLLSLAGISDANPMIGYDLTHNLPPEKQRAMMQYGENFALITQDTATILRPNLPPSVFQHDGRHLTKQIQDYDQARIDHALSLVLWSNLAYQKGYYTLPSEHSDVAVSEVQKATNQSPAL